MTRHHGLVAALIAAPLLTGCTGKLETGYAPNRLSASAAQQRAYYAEPYSPEAEAAAAESKAPDVGGRHTPGAAY